MLKKLEAFCLLTFLLPCFSSLHICKERLPKKKTNMGDIVPIGRGPVNPKKIGTYALKEGTMGPVSELYVIIFSINFNQNVLSLLGGGRGPSFFYCTNLIMSQSGERGGVKEIWDNVPPYQSFFWEGIPKQIFLCFTNQQFQHDYFSSNGL